MLCPLIGAVVYGVALIAIGGAAINPVFAETIEQALVGAYETNPTLKAARARQRATDELVPQALSGWRPQVSLQGELGFEHLRSNNVQAGDDFFDSIDETNPASISIGLSQPIFRGFKTVESVRQAQADVQAGRQELLATEQEVLLDAARAYLDVLRNRRVLALRKKNEDVLREQLQASRLRFDAGEITRTDVEQARARFALSQATRAQAEADLSASNALYERIVGHLPGKLDHPQLIRLPDKLDQAIAIAERNNPQVVAASFAEESAEHYTKVARAALLPQVTLEASSLYSVDDLGRTKFAATELYTAGLVVSVPLYESGSVASSVRQAKHVASERRLESIAAVRAVREIVVIRWSSFESAQQTIRAAKAQVEASRSALSGVRQEYLVGSRTTLDVLNAESELVEAEVLLAQAERDKFLASFQLAAAMGGLTANSLKLPVRLYDPIENYQSTRDRWFGLRIKTFD